MLCVGGSGARRAACARPRVHQQPGAVPPRVRSPSAQRPRPKASTAAAAGGSRLALLPTGSRWPTMPRGATCKSRSSSLTGLGSGATRRRRRNARRWTIRSSATSWTTTRTPPSGCGAQTCRSSSWPGTTRRATRWHGCSASSPAALSAPRAYATISRDLSRRRRRRTSARACTRRFAFGRSARWAPLTRDPRAHRARRLRRYVHP